MNRRPPTWKRTLQEIPIGRSVAARSSRRGEQSGQHTTGRRFSERGGAVHRPNFVPAVMNARCGRVAGRGAGATQSGHRKRGEDVHFSGRINTTRSQQGADDVLLFARVVGCFSRRVWDMGAYKKTQDARTTTFPFTRSSCMNRRPPTWKRTLQETPIGCSVAARSSRRGEQSGQHTTGRRFSERGGAVHRPNFVPAVMNARCGRVAGRGAGATQSAHRKRGEDVHFSGRINTTRSQQGADDVLLFARVVGCFSRRVWDMGAYKKTQDARTTTFPFTCSSCMNRRPPTWKRTLQETPIGCSVAARSSRRGEQSGQHTTGKRFTERGGAVHRPNFVPAVMNARCGRVAGRGAGATQSAHRKRGEDVHFSGRINTTRSQQGADDVLLFARVVGCFSRRVWGHGRLQKNTRRKNHNVPLHTLILYEPTPSNVEAHPPRNSDWALSCGTVLKTRGTKRSTHHGQALQ